MSFLVQNTTSADRIPIGDLLDIETSHRFSAPGIGAVQRLSVGPGETGEIVRVDHHLTFVREGVTELQSKHDGKAVRRQTIYPGCLHVRPAGVAHASTWNSRVGLTIVSLEVPFLRNHAHDLVPRENVGTPFQPMIGIKDKFLWHLGARLDALVATKDPPTIFIEQILSTVAMHLALTSDRKPASMQMRALSQRAIRRTREYVEANLSTDIRLETLASLSGLSMFHFSRQFSREMGIGVGRYVQICKMRRAAEMLTGSKSTIAEIAETVGYRDASSFSRAFQGIYGLSPRNYRSGALGG